MGSKHTYPNPLPLPAEIFMKIWTEKLQHKIFKESNDYVNWVDPTTRMRKKGDVKEPIITLPEFRKFTEIYILMVVHNQKSLRDY